MFNKEEIMGKLCVTTLDDTAQSAAKMKHAIWQRFGFDCQLKERSASMLIFRLPEEYQWTREDAEFMRNLVDQSDLVASWHYVENSDNNAIKQGGSNAI